MPYLTTPHSHIYYERKGDGPPLLLLPPGGLDATINFWERTAFNPLNEFYREFSLIALDTRNSGRSRGELPEGDPWEAYADDHLALLDALGIERALMLGCCIGCSHALKLANRAPERVAAMVLEQPMGRSSKNGAVIDGVGANWVKRMSEESPRMDANVFADFVRRMWKDDLIFSVPREMIATCRTPMLVLPGIDDFHPASVGEEVARLAPNAAVLRGWKESPAQIANAVQTIREYLHAHW